MAYQSAPLVIPWGNVWQASYRVLAELGRNPGDPLYGALYVEGRTVRPDGAVSDHGWLELGDRIIDPTLWDTGRVYFPGPRWTLEELEAAAFDGRLEAVEQDEALATYAPKINKQDAEIDWTFVREIGEIELTVVGERVIHAVTDKVKHVIVILAQTALQTDRPRPGPEPLRVPVRPALRRGRRRPGLVRSRVPARSRTTSNTASRWVVTGSRAARCAW